MKKLVFMSILMLAFVLVFWAGQSVQAQVDTAWVRTYNGTANGNDRGAAVTVDANGNVCVTGSSFESVNGLDYVTIKYHANGDTAWIRKYNDVANGPDLGVAIAVDGFNDVCVTGNIWGAGNFDYASIKYHPDGMQLWLVSVNLGGTDIAHDVAADNAGNVYVLGSSWTSTTNNTNYFTIKYNPDGSLAWGMSFNGPANGDDSASAIAVDNAGNVYVTGQSKIQSTPYTVRGYGTVKYGPAGNFVWSQFIGAQNFNWLPDDLVVDGSSNVYITGRGGLPPSGTDYLTAKYSTDGTLLWQKFYNGPGNGSDFAFGITVDGSGNVYVTGQSVGTSLDYATIKYYPNGDTAWVRRFDGGYTDDFASSIAIDDSGNVYVTGGSIGNGTGFDCTTIKYDPNGDIVWSTRYNGSGNSDDYGGSIAVDDSGNVYITGACTGSGTLYDIVTIKYKQQPSACAYLTGDVNGSASYNGLDVTYGVAYLKGGNPPLCEPCALCPDWHYCGDVNGSCSYNGLDITYGVAFLKGGPALIPCPACPPTGPMIYQQSVPKNQD